MLTWGGFLLWVIRYLGSLGGLHLLDYCTVHCEAQPVALCTGFSTHYSHHCREQHLKGLFCQDTRTQYTLCWVVAHIICELYWDWVIWHLRPVINLLVIWRRITANQFLCLFFLIYIYYTNLVYLVDLILNVFSKIITNNSFVCDAKPQLKLTILEDLEGSSATSWLVSWCISGQVVSFPLRNNFQLTCFLFLLFLFSSTSLVIIGPVFMTKSRWQ